MAPQAPPGPTPVKLTRNWGQRGDVLRARPVKGDIDYAKLSREHIARYPKILARLAK